MNREPESTIDLIHAHRSGDEGALDRLMRRYLPIAMSIAAKQLGADCRQQADIEDIAQDALHSVLRTIDRFEPDHDGAMRAYLGQVIKNRIRDRARVGGAGPRVAGRVAATDFEEPRAFVPASSATSPTLHARRKEHAARFESALAELPETDRRIVELAIVEKRSIKEVAATLGWRAGSVRSRLSRVLAKLSQDLA